MYFVRFVLFCTDVVNEFLEKNCPYVAAAIAFYTLFSLFPLFLVIVTILAFVLGPGIEREELVKSIAEALPVSREFISDTLEGVVRARALTGVFSVLGLLWASSAAFSAIRKGINAAWGIRRTRPFLRERLIDLGLVLGAGLVVLASLLVVPVLRFLQQIGTMLAPDASLWQVLVWGLGAHLVAPGLAFATFLVMYRFLPNTRMIRLGDVWIGALAASMAFYAASQVFVWYVTRFPVYNIVYGSVGAVMVLLTWAYVSAIILLFGALLTSRYAACALSRPKEEQGLRVLWTGLAHVRIRVVESPAPA